MKQINEKPEKKTSLWRIQFLFCALLLCGLTHNIYAQEKINYTGSVSDEGGLAIPGVTIQIKGTTSGTLTNTDGNFSIQASEGEVLVFSFIGFDKEEITLSNQQNIQVTLKASFLQLEEVVAVGYGVTRKMDLTGAVGSLSSDELNQGAITNPLQQMSGRVAGVNITQTGNEPGASPTVRIRGITSLIGGNDPLVVVDGIQGNMDLLNQVPPSEIKSIDILKDASATAIYGSRGAPGVIIVTTKNAEEGKSTVEYNGTVSFDVIADKLDMMSANEWERQALNWGVDYSAWHGSDTDWHNLLTQMGKTENHTISFGSGTENFSYRASLSAILQEGVVINSDNNKYIARLQATQKALDDKLTLTLNLNNSIRTKDGSPGSVGRAAFTSNLITNAYYSRSTDPVLASDGSYFFDENVFQYINPYAVAQEVVQEEEETNQFASLKADLEIINGLTLSGFGSWRKVNFNSGYYASPKSTLAYARERNGVGNVATNKTDEKLFNVSSTYLKNIGKHKVNALALYEWQRQTYQGHFAQRKGLNDITTYNALQLGSIDDHERGDISSYKNDRTLISFLGRINYSFADKYFLTASVRQDGSSVFGQDYKWGTFPSASIAWRLSEESFIQDIESISNLKLRASYGVTGNQQGLYPQNSLQLVGESGTIYFNGELITNYAVTQNSNQDIRWETRYQTNLGVDFGFFNGNLNGSIDVFVAKTKNMLFDYTVPQPPYPFGSIKANVGEMQNKGIEFALDARVINTNDITLTLGGNFSLLENEVVELNGSINGVPLNTNYVPWGESAFLVKGKPIGAYYIYENDGKDASTNEEKVVDQNNDGEIDLSAESEDRYYAGSSIPTYTFSFTPTFRYKNFDVSMLWRGSGGNKIYNRIRKDFSFFESLGKQNLLTSANDLGIYTSKYSSDLWLEDGDFIRFENLTLGYTMKDLKVKYVNRVRFSVTATNLLLITNYSGLDPELNVSGDGGSGVDAGIYPKTKSIAFGVNVTF